MSPAGNLYIVSLGMNRISLRQCQSGTLVQWLKVEISAYMRKRIFPCFCNYRRKDIVPVVTH